MLGQLRRLGTRGDTIVEVMIVLAVLGLAISITYATANRSLLNSRQAQENAEATGFAQAQLEGLRYLAPDADALIPAKNVFANNTLACVKADNSGLGTIIGTNTTITGAGASNYSADCQRGNLPYYVAETYCTTGSLLALCTNVTNDTFVVRVTWDDVLGDGQDTVTLSYRLHP